MVALLPPLLALAACLATAASALAQAAEGEAPLVDVRAGFDGLAKAGRWLPVQVTLANDGPGFEGEVRVVTRSPGGPSVAYGERVELPTRSRKLVRLAAPAPASARELRVELVSDGREIAHRDGPVRLLGASEFLVGVLADDDVPPAGLGSLRRGGGAVSLARIGLGDLPTDAVALQALDAILVRNRPAGRLGPQRTALRAWIEAGGQLVVAGGPGWRRSVDGLEDLLPIEGLVTTEVGHLRALGRYAGGAPADGAILLAAGSPAPGARVILSQDGVPLIVERWLGQGRVTFLAADPSLEPFRSWPGAEGLWQRVLVGGRPLFPPIDDASTGPFELEVRAVLVQLMELGLPSPGWLAAFLLAYVVCVGPLQYGLLRRIDRREWAWIGFPALALGFAGLAYVGGGRLRGLDVRSGAVSIVRAAPDAETAPIDTWVGLVTPTRRSYALDFVDGAAPRVLPSMGGLAGDTPLVLGAHGGPPLRGPTRLPDLRLEARTLQAFHSRAFGPSPTPVRAEIRATSGRLEGLVTNVGPDRLEDALVLAAGESLMLGDIAPGESRPVSLALPTTRPPGPAFRPPRLGSSGAWRDRAELQRSVATSVLNRGGDGEGAGGAVLVAWTAATPPRLTANGDAITGLATRLLEQALPIHYGDDHLVIPPGLLGRTLLDGAALSRGAAPSFVVRGPIVFQYDLPPEVVFGQVDRLSVHLAIGRPSPGVAPPLATGGSAPSPSSNPPGASSTVRVSLFRWADRTWVEAPLVSTGVADVVFGDQFVDGGAIRLRVESNGPEAFIQQLDLSLEGPRG